MKTILFWLRNARSLALPQSMMPAILSICIAIRRDGFSLILGLLAIIGVAAGHLSANLFDDYFDYKVKKTEFRRQMEHQGMRARIAKCTYLTSGEATIQQLLIASLVFGAIALIIGAIIYLFRGRTILIITVITGAICVFYSGYPLRLSYRGLSEIVIGIVFGPLLMAGVFYAACGVFDVSLLFISIPVGLLVTNIVYSHAIMDYEPDKAVGKMTFAVLLKNKRWMLFFLAFILISAFAIIVSGVVGRFLSPYYLFSLLTTPLAIRLFYLMGAFIHDPKRTFTPRFWMGPMNNWKQIKEVGVDWFMIRWLLARNLLTFFCIILMIVSLLL